MEMIEYVIKFDVLDALRERRDILMDKTKQEWLYDSRDSMLCYQRGIIDSIEIIKKVKGEWK